MNLGEIVKEYRQRNKITMEDFAKKSGLSKGYISMLEKNENPKTKEPIIPSLKTIRQISEAINIDFNELISIMDTNQKVSLKKTDEDNLSTIAAHHDGDWTEEELEEIEKFKDYVRSKRQK